MEGREKRGVGVNEDLFRKTSLWIGLDLIGRREMLFW